MPVIPDIERQADALTAIRRDIHAHPELGFEETRTAALVAERLRAWGVDEVHEGIGTTGVVGIVRGRGPGNRSVGLRADMDALPIQEATDLSHASTIPGKMHACGHDGHTTMLLGAAQYLARTRNFAGTAVLIFQPAEEGLGGARRMLAEGLFTRFPCDEVYGLHNNPGAPHGQIGVKPGPAMAGASFFDITVEGLGSHAAMPHQGRDPIVVAAALVQEMQTIVSRNLPATAAAVLSITQIHAGSAYNVVPDRAVLTGTIRWFEHAIRDLIHDRIAALCAGLGQAHGVTITPDLRTAFDVLVNDADLAQEYLAAAADVVGPQGAVETAERRMGSEDFADMLHQVPGAYCTLGHHGTVPLHNPGFVLDDACLPVGASVLARIVERRLPL